MAGGIPRTAGGRRWLGGVVLGAMLLARAGLAQPPTAAASRVRPADEKAAGLLSAGWTRSETFRSLLETLERSDLVVHVETGVQALPGQVRFVATTPTCRYLRVTVRIPGLEDDLLPWLAHELWHATEIADAPEVRSQESLRSFYERVGGSLRGGSELILETAAAQRAQVIVERELRLGGQPGRKRSQ